MKLRIREAQATSSFETVGFSRKRRNAGKEELKPLHLLSYPPPCAEALALAALRIELDLSLSEAASAIRVRRSELGDLEHGRALPADPNGWELASEALRKAAQDRENRAAETAWPAVRPRR